MGIFKGGINVQKAADTIFSGIDKSVLSREELVDYTIKSMDADLEFQKVTQDESTPRSITRRVIAIMILAQYFLAFNVGLAGMITKKYDGKAIIELSTAAFATLAISVVVFYFGNHMLKALIPKFADMKDNRKQKRENKK